MASLVIVSGSEAGRYYPLGRRTNVIGRDEGLLIQLLDEHVSRKHLQVRYDKEESRYYVSDMKSRHGTFVNGARVTEETPLNEDDLIDAGGLTMQFTHRKFDTPEGALRHYRQTGQRVKGTIVE